MCKKETKKWFFRVGLKNLFTFLGSVLAEFLPSFPSQIWVSDVILVTIFCDKMWRVTLVTFLRRKWRSRTRICFWTGVTSFPENVTFWPRRYKTFLNGKKCDDSEYCRCRTRRPGWTGLIGPGAVLVLIQNAGFVRNNGTKQTKWGHRGRKPACKKLLGWCVTFLGSVKWGGNFHPASLF